MPTTRLFWRSGLAYLDIHSQDGRRKKVALGTRDPAVAQAMLEEARARQLRGVNAVQAGLTWAEAAPRYLAQKRQEGRLAASTLTVQGERLRGVILPMLGTEALSALDVPAFVQRLRERGLGRKSVKNVLDDASSVLWWATEAGLIPANPVRSWREQQRRGRTKSDARPQDFRALTHDEAERLLAKASTSQHYGLILMAHDCGLRVGELRGLRWEDVAFGSCREDRSRSLWVCQNWPTGGNPGEIPKTGKARRVQLSWRARVWLREELSRRMGAKLEEPAGMIFGYFDNGTLRHHLHTLARRAGIVPLSLLDLRHTWASRMLTLGFPIEFIARQLGHSPTTCRSHYARHLAEEYVEPPRLEPWQVPADALVGGERGEEAGRTLAPNG